MSDLDPHPPKCECAFTRTAKCQCDIDKVIRRISPPLIWDLHISVLHYSETSTCQSSIILRSPRFSPLFLWDLHVWVLHYSETPHVSPSLLWDFHVSVSVLCYTVTPMCQSSVILRPPCISPPLLWYLHMSVLHYSETPYVNLPRPLCVSIL